MLPRLTVLSSALLLLTLPAARAQGAPDPSPGPLVEEVLVPEEALDEVLRRHPGGVIVRQDELEALLDKAGVRPGPTAKPEAPPPLSAALERVRVSGRVVEGVADLTAEAEVSLLGAGPVYLPLPLGGIGLRAATVDGQPARLLRSREGPVVLLEGQPDGSPATRKVVWRFAVRVEPGEERGSGSVTFPAPLAASGRLELLVPGQVEVHAAENVVVWTEASGADETRAVGAFGGATAAAPQLTVRWRPRLALQAVEPYAVAEERSLYLVRQGVVTLESVVLLAVYRAEREGFQLDLPPGFVVRSLEPVGQGTGELTFVQQADRVLVRFAAPREGVLQLRLRAELATGQVAGPEQLVLRPLGFPDLQRAGGLVGIARGEGTVVRFGEVVGLERADLGALGASNLGGLLRVYRRDRALGARGSAQKLELETRPVEPKVDLQLKAAFQLDERSISALAAFRFVVSEGRVFGVRCELPPGFELETTVVRDGEGNQPTHQLKPERAGEQGQEERTSLVVELPDGLAAGQELLVTVQARRDEPQGLAGRTLGVPRLTGSPAAQVSGFLGFSPDASFRLQGADLAELTPIPAEELPRVGLQVPGLVLGYRIEAGGYAGNLRLLRRETRLSSEALVMHRVREQVVETEARFELDVQEAPVSALELLVPAGVGHLMRVEGEHLQDDRELLGAAPDGRERWRVPFARRQSGRVTLSVKFDTTLPAGDASGEGEVSVEALPRVSVGSAFRDRGVVAVYSSDATELDARPQGLRAIEVTEVPGAEGRSRPLFAFTYVGQEQRLGLTIKRRKSAEVLTAVAEALHLKSMVGADGLGRHEATFELKNLNNQFFALRLPEGAVLWSVCVDGPEGELEGVKPAEQGGLRLIPIPSAGTKGPNEVTRVVATYTLPGGALGGRGQLALVAPALLVNTDVPVPVLHSTWELCLPDQVRVLEFEGNLVEQGGPDGRRGHQVKTTPALAVVLGRDLTRERAFWWASGLLLVGLLVTPSARARGFLVELLAGGLSAGRSARGGLGSGLRGLLASRATRIGALGLGLLLVLGSCLLFGVRSSRRALHSTFDKATRKIDLDISAEVAGGGGVSPPTAGEASEGYEYAQAAKETKDYDEASTRSAAPMPTPAPMEPMADAAPGAPPPPPPAAAPKPMRQLAARDKAVAEKAKEELRRREERMDDEADAPAAEPEPMTEASGEELAELEGNALVPQTGARAGRGNRPRAPAEQPPMQQPMSPPDESGAGPADGSERYDRNEQEQLLGLLATREAPAPRAEIPTPELGHVGLRSLVLELPPVGQRFWFERAGGSPALAVRYVRERLLTVGGGALAILGFSLALVLPRRLKVSYLGLLLLVSATATALPFVVLPVTVTPALNAVLAGTLLAAPVHLCLALAALWRTRPLERLGRAVVRSQEARRAPRAASSVGRAGAAPRAGAALLLLGLLFGGAGAARADEPAPRGQPQAQPPRNAETAPPRVYVPYDPDQPEAPSSRVYVPREVYEWLWKLAYPGRLTEEALPPPAPALVTRVEYVGAVEGQQLGLSVKVTVDVLGQGWQRCPLGLAGTGLQGSQVRGGKPEARVVVAPAGGYELVAQGPGTYEVTLDVRAAASGGGWTFATVPALAAEMRVTAPAGQRRVVVGGARAQVERPLGQGQVEVTASLGEAPRVQLSFASREVMTAGGSSEASAATRTLCWVRRGRLVVMQTTTFAISGAGREGFVFAVPPGLEVTSVEAPSLRAWSVEDGKLTVALRRPSGSSITVKVLGEQLLAAAVSRFPLPQLEAQGVSREAGSVGFAVEDGLKVLPVEAGLRQVASAELDELAGTLGRGAGQPVRVERAFGFARRPSPLELELIEEPAEVSAEAQVQAVILADRTRVRARIAYDVRRGAVYELLVAVPAELELVGAPRGVEAREVDAGQVEGGMRRLRFGLASRLSGQAVLELTLERRHAMGEAGATLPFPDLRVLGAAQETTLVGIAALPGVELKLGRDPAGLRTVDAKGATRGWPAPEGGTEWKLAWRRSGAPASAQAAPSVGQVQARRPAARVTGTWVLHVRVEHDVVRYVLRALYTIEAAGCRSFSALLPAEVGDRVAVEAPNLREVTTSEVEGGMRRFQVELQSPAESFYDLALSWEQVLEQGKPFQVDRVGVTGVERQLRGFVLVEKAPEVPDQLQMAEMSGEVQKSRAAEAPALPPGRAPSDFAFVWKVPSHEASAPWSIALRLEAPGTQRLPAPARVPWAQVTTVVTSEGQARHRAVYRVRNLRLQFLALELPEVQQGGGAVPADVWSVFVDGEPKRLHREGKTLLIPLPKRTDADRSFEVEVTYATPLPDAFRFGSRVPLLAPVLRTEKVEVERTFWSVYLPQDWDYSGFSGNVEETAAVESRVQELVGQVEELRDLERLAQRGTGNARQVADENVYVQLEVIKGNLRQIGSLSGASSDGKGKSQAELLALARKTGSEFQQLEQQIQSRRQEAQGQLAGQQDAGSLAQNVQVEDQQFEQMASGWYSNSALTKGKNRVEWSGLEGQGGGQQQAADAWTLAVPEGQELDLRNAEVFQQKGGRRQEQKRMFQNRGYDMGQQEAEVQKEQQRVQQAQGRFRAQNLAPQQGQQGQGGQQAQQAPQSAVQTVEDLTRALDMNAPHGEPSAPGHEGLLSIRVAFPTPGRAFHFASQGAAQPELSFTVYPLHTAERGARIARGVVLIVLLIGAFRLGILGALPGRRAQQALLLIATGALAALTFAHVGGAALAFLVGLVMLRHGRLATAP